ncbi:hypothetical protein Tco_0784926 [Tanacetum coccineum]
MILEIWCLRSGNGGVFVVVRGGESIMEMDGMWSRYSVRTLGIRSYGDGGDMVMSGRLKGYTDILSFMNSTKSIVHDSSSLNHQDVEPSNVQSSSHPLSIPSSPDTNQQVSTTKIPNAGMRFDFEEELQLYFQEYAYQVGFGVRRKSVRTERDKKYYAFACSKQGVHVPKSGSTK